MEKTDTGGTPVVGLDHRGFLRELSEKICPESAEKS